MSCTTGSHRRGSISRKQTKYRPRVRRSSFPVRISDGIFVRAARKERVKLKETGWSATSVWGRLRLSDLASTSPPDRDLRGLPFL